MTQPGNLDQPPEKIGKYSVRKEIGRGAMGTVYQAHDRAMNRIVALKVIQTSEDDDPGEREFKCSRLMKDARNAGILSHLNIVRILDLGYEGGAPFIAMEFIDGPTLKAALGDEKRLPFATVARYARQIAQALDYAHKRGIIHRDIKPENIMLGEEETLKVADFGISKATKSGMTEQTITESGLVLGTPHYMAPEQVQCLKLDGRSDQFSLAVLVYEMLTGSRPFDADDVPAVLFKIVYEDPKPPREVNPELGPGVSDVTLKALSKLPGDRYETCLAFVNDLESAAAADEAGLPFESTGYELPTASFSAASRFLSRTLTSHVLVAYTRITGGLWRVCDMFAATRGIPSAWRSMTRASQRAAIAAGVTLVVALASLLGIWAASRRSPPAPAPAVSDAPRADKPALPPSTPYAAEPAVIPAPPPKRGSGRRRAGRAPASLELSGQRRRPHRKRPPRRPPPPRRTSSRP
jgi:predicted Ser/Thr protein kinase